MKKSKQVTISKVVMRYGRIKAFKGLPQLIYRYHFQVLLDQKKIQVVKIQLFPISYDCLTLRYACML